ncbi:hypothetical protein BCR34DRAFT_628115 [Clohesyomyces aquaticus]|uniref:RING-type domain-containing protein n=1 Tax=Clohesyomyces aquaticus TaxID=1231657 RepID=A0A1Y1YPG0_9PLEO|nr:hypothetical protein BCR34DRAFT_628115 [Clohesyomyces aquaticus]
MSSPTTSSIPPPAATSQGSGGSGPTSSPLLFFVALGFGVVFTNLWIIVGVKYCFRYNQRNRAARAAADGEPIDLAAMPRPHRRRREKKLMSMDEVNERFPLTKYKAWKASREDEGLPTAGGITTAPQSRATSLKDVEAVIAPSGHIRASVEAPRPSSARDDRTVETASSQQPTSPKESVAPGDKKLEAKETEKAVELAKVETVATSHYQPDKPTDANDADDSDDDDPIRTAAAPEMLAEPGDTCAICLDTLEEDDDVRGLTCGHAFHASCVDPWLTSRRACCPLCKADYYVPKPRPAGEADQPGVTGLRTPTSPGAAWVGAGRNPFTRSRVVFISNSRQNTAQNNQQPAPYALQSVLTRPSRHNRAADRQQPQPQPQPPAQSGETPSWRTRLAGATSSRPTMPSWFGRNRNNGAADNTTPAQLEAGNR